MRRERGTLPSETVALFHFDEERGGSISKHQAARLRLLFTVDDRHTLPRNDSIVRIKINTRRLTERAWVADPAAAFSQFSLMAVRV